MTKFIVLIPLFFQLTACEQKIKQAVKKPAVAKPAMHLPTKKDSIYTAVEISPRFKGSFRSFLEKNMRYPPEANHYSPVGSIIIEFIVDKRGLISNIQVAAECAVKNPVLVKEFIALIAKTNGQWLPGMVNGKPVASWRQQRISTHPQEEE
jgi:hypothetical protein